MKVNARNFELPDPKLRALCLAIAMALALPAAAFAQEAQTAPAASAEQQASQEEQAKPEEAGSSVQGELFSIEESDEPEVLRELTQIHNVVDFGFIYVSDDSYKFGRYTGLADKGFYALLNIDWFERGAWDDESARYWRFTGENLGLDSREAGFEYGVQGKYKVYIDYDEIPNYYSDSGSTIFTNPGSTSLDLPSNWVGSGTTAGMTQLLPSLQPIDLKTERRRTGLGYNGIINRNWDYSLSYRHESKEGTKSTGAIFGTNGGNPRAVIAPEPVDYTTEQIDASVRYTSRKFQLEAAYYLSLFSDANTALQWANPYTTISGWAAGTGYPSGVGQLGLPPDSRFEQASLSAGYNFSEATRLSGSFSSGRMTQNDTFLPYTDIASLAASITQPLPRDSLDGEIDTTVFNLRLSSRPTSDFAWNMSYRYDDRDNQTPRSEYVYIAGDAQTQNTAVTSNTRRFNEPYSYRNEDFKVDASYRLFGNTDVSLGAQFSTIDRTYTEREQADEDTYTLGFNTAISDQLNSHIRYSHAKRDGSTYVGNEPFLSGYSPGYTSTTPGWDNHPQLVRFYQANRDRDQLAINVEFTPTEALTLGAGLDYTDDQYNESEVGLVDATSESVTFDAVYAPSELWSIYGFYTYESLSANQNGHSFSGGAVQVAQAADPKREWSAHQRERVDSTGFGYKRTTTSGRFDFGLDYLRSKSWAGYDFAVGSALTTKPLPRDTTVLDSLNLYATYKMRDNLSVRMAYWYEEYSSSDWAVDGIDANQLANVILLGEDSPDYNDNVVSLSMIYRF